MAIKTINIGSSQNKGDGDPLRDAFRKINENFTEVSAKLTALEDGDISTDIKGSVFADDSTLLVDAVNATIPYSVLSGTPTIPTTIKDLSGDYSGSVFGDDSTLLVDGINNAIPAANLTGALPALDGSALVNLPGGGGIADLQAVTAVGAVTANQVTFNGGIIVDAMQPSVGVGPTVHTGNFDIQGTLSLSGSIDASIDVLQDVDTTTAAPSRDSQPLVWDTIDGNWYPGNGLSLSAILRMEAGGMLYMAENTTMVFEGTTANAFETTITATEPSQDNAISIPNASGTFALTSDIPVAGVETYNQFGTSTSSNLGLAATTAGNYFLDEAGTADVEVSFTVTNGFTKALVTLNASIMNVTDGTTEAEVALERIVNGGVPTLVKALIFPVANTFYGGMQFTVIDTHGASAGDTVSYKIKNRMDVNYSSESCRLVTGITGDTIGAKEIA